MGFPKLAWSTIHLPDEKQLLYALAAGDETAFRTIFDTYQQAVFSYGLHLLRNEEMADDLVQETFMRVWLYRQQLLKVQSFNAWLFTVVKNKLIDLLRAKLKLQKLQRGIPLAPAIADTDEALLSKEYDMMLYRAMDQLTPQQRQVFRLSRQQGLRTQEIATQLNISPLTVRSHLVQALRTIRRLVQPHLGALLLFLEGLKNS